MEGSIYNRRRLCVQKLQRLFKITLADLHTERHARRTEEQKIAQQFVVISPRIKTCLTQKIFQNPAISPVLKHSHVEP